MVCRDLAELSHYARVDNAQYRLIKSLTPGPYTFILQRFDSEHAVFRLAGTEICHLFGREFRDQNFLNLWEYILNVLIGFYNHIGFPNFCE